MKFLSSEKLSNHKYKTPEGYLICTDAILSRTGKQTYRRNEVFTDSDDDSEIEIDRTAEEVFSPETLASFENKPITVEHPDENVTSENYNELSVGFVRDVKKSNINGQDVMTGTLVITDEKTIEEIENGEHTDLSCGYDCDILDETNPQQRNIRGNHVALCEQGRAGIARIVDSLKDDKISYSKKFIEEIPYKAREEMRKSSDKKTALLSIVSELQQCIDLAAEDEKNDIKLKANKILKDLKQQFSIDESYIRLTDKGEKSMKDDIDIIEKYKGTDDGKTYKIYEVNNKFYYDRFDEKGRPDNLNIGPYKDLEEVRLYLKKHTSGNIKKIEDSINDSQISIGKTYTSKNNDKLTITGIYTGIDDYDGSPIIEISYKYNTHDGRTGTSRCNTKDFHRMLNDSIEDSINDYAPDYAIWVKKNGNWIPWGATNNKNIDVEHFLNRYEDVTVVKNGTKPLKDITAAVESYNPEGLTEDASYSEDDLKHAEELLMRARDDTERRLLKDLIRRIKEELHIVNDDIEKAKGGWVNRGKEGTHGVFATKKEAREQQKAMFARGYKGDSKYTIQYKVKDTNYIRIVKGKSIDEAIKKITSKSSK